MKPTTIIISAVLASLIVAAMIGLISNMSYKYGNTDEFGDLNELNQLNSTYNFATNFSSEVQNQESGISQEGITALSVGEKLWNSIKILGKALTYIPRMILIAGDTLHVPSYISYAFVGIVILVFIVGILTLVGVIKDVY